MKKDSAKIHFDQKQQVTVVVKKSGPAKERPPKQFKTTPDATKTGLGAKAR